MCRWWHRPTGRCHAWPFCRARSADARRSRAKWASAYAAMRRRCACRRASGRHRSRRASVSDWMSVPPVLVVVWRSSCTFGLHCDAVSIIFAFVFGALFLLRCFLCVCRMPVCVLYMYYGIKNPNLQRCNARIPAHRSTGTRRAPHRIGPAMWSSSTATPNT